MKKTSGLQTIISKTANEIIQLWKLLKHYVKAVQHNAKKNTTMCY